MKKNISFEEALARLNEITDELEKSDISLDEALKLYEEGNKLSNLCNEKIESAKLKITVINSSKNKQENENE